MLRVLKREQSYFKLLIAGIINGIGDRFSQVAMLSLILQLTGSGLSVGITMALRMLPFLLFGPFSSTIAKKWSRKNLLVFTDFTRALIAFSFLLVNSKEDLWIIYTGSFLLSCGEAFYGPTRKSSIPSIVDQRNIKEVNAWEQVSLGFVLIAGALSGGIISYLFGAKAAFIMNICSFLGAGLIINTIPTLEAFQSKSGSIIHQEKLSRFFPIIIGSAFLLLILSFDVLAPLINGIENILLSVYAVKTYGMGDLGVGILYSVLGTGFIFSPILSRWIKGNYLRFAFICLFMEGVILTGISRAADFTIVVILFGILTIFSGVGNTLLDTAVMQTIPAKWQGIYFGISATIANTCIGISMFMTGVLLEYLSPRMMGLIGGILYISLGGIYFLLSIKINLSHEKHFLEPIVENPTLTGAVDK